VILAGHESGGFSIPPTGRLTVTMPVTWEFSSGLGIWGARRVLTAKRYVWIARASKVLCSMATGAPPFRQSDAGTSTRYPRAPQVRNSLVIREPSRPRTFRSSRRGSGCRADCPGEVFHRCGVELLTCARVPPRAQRTAPGQLSARATRARAATGARAPGACAATNVRLAFE
jgi:hypothetical protein